MKGILGRNKEGKLIAHFTSEFHKAAVMDFIRFTKTNSHVDVQLIKQGKTRMPFGRGETSTAKQ